MDTFLTSLRRLGPFAARRVAASSPPSPFLMLVNIGVQVEKIRPLTWDRHSSGAQRMQHQQCERTQ